MMPRKIALHSPTVCEYDVVFTHASAVGCAPTKPRPWAADHFHAVVDGRPCRHKHASWDGLFGMHPEIERAPKIAVGTRVRQRESLDFLVPTDRTGIVVGFGSAPGLVRVRLDAPVRCSFDGDELHDLLEYSADPATLEVLAP